MATSIVSGRRRRSSGAAGAALSGCDVPGVGLHSLHKSSFIFTACLRDREYDYLYFTDEKTET